MEVKSGMGIETRKKEAFLNGNKIITATLLTGGFPLKH